MLIKMKINTFLFLLALSFALSLSVACSNSSNTTKAKDGYNQQNVDILFKKAQNLFDQVNPKEAYKIFMQLADQGYPKAQNALGNGYQHGFWGDIDLKKAEYWYQKAADQNYFGGMHNLGILNFSLGKYQQALPYFEKAASLDYADSINMLGVYYSEGIVFDQDYKKALEYFDKALDVDKNNASAQFNVGQAYYYGHGVEKNYNKAFAWYVKAADQDYSLAQIQLAEMYFSGKAVPKNVKKAIEIIKPLAELGDPKAQENLKWYIDHQS